MVKHLVVTLEDEKLIVEALNFLEGVCDDTLYVYGSESADPVNAEWIKKTSEKKDRLRQIINGIEQTSRQTSI